MLLLFGVAEIEVNIMKWLFDMEFYVCLDIAKGISKQQCYYNRVKHFKNFLVITIAYMVFKDYKKYDAFPTFHEITSDAISNKDVYLCNDQCKTVFNNLSYFIMRRCLFNVGRLSNDAVRAVNR